MELWTVKAETGRFEVSGIGSFDAAWKFACATADRNPGRSFFVLCDGLVVGVACTPVDGREAF